MRRRTLSRPISETLERRVMLSGTTFHWTGLGDGLNWHDPQNWSTQAVPGIAHDVVIDRTAPNQGPLVVAQSAAARSIAVNTMVKIEPAGELLIAHNSNFDAPLTVAGRLNLLPGNDAVIRMVDLTLGDGSPGARVDVADGTLLIDYSDVSPMAEVFDHLSRGYNDGEWTGPGITSSVAAANHANAVGCAEAADVVIAVHNILPAAFFDDTTLIVRYTLAGDANLDRTVNLSDSSILATVFGRPQDVIPTWSEGNFNYDGTTNLTDFNILAASFGNTLLPSQAPVSVFSPIRVTDGLMESFLREIEASL
jgi:hypothetical protein